ncbi:TadE family protein [Microbacterium saccharophilum]|uniref:TadE family protein n=1 Tax=Microbacterium saccharophilum TaxID=1213358 RepID=A0A5C8I729_9MICO|nr:MULTISPECIES: hypothetical protein [Microbacterium]TXK14119.1 TadE family protein [Microbacterium saccharophilum]GEP46666.1 hypothetical protein MSA03_01740 [Microbacterium saccharophilum]SFI26398.1 hypothetical protein SAMN04487751_0741 [Microbacterium saccharophilum]
MRPQRAWTDEDTGAAALEFILVGLVLLVPVVYLIVALGSIQAHALGVEAGSRHIARAIATAPDAATADARAREILASVTQEYGIDPGAVQVSVGCRPAGAACPSAGATLLVTLTTAVPLPLVPPVLDLDRVARVPVEAVTAQKVSRFWGTG